MSLRVREVSAMVGAALVLAACGGGSGTGENDNRLRVSTDPDRTVDANSVVVVRGQASNKDSFIERMYWTIRDTTFDARTDVRFRDGGECLFDAEGGETRDFGVEDAKTCAAELEIGPFLEDGRIDLELTAVETGGLSKSTNMRLTVRAGGKTNNLVVTTDPNRTVTANSVIFVQGRATNRDSLIKMMKWSIGSASFDRRTFVNIIGEGECDFDVDEGAAGDGFGIVDERVCSTAVEMGPFPGDDDIILSLTAVEAGGMSRSDEMRLAVRSSANALVADAGSDRALPAPASLEHSCTFAGGFFFDARNPNPRYSWSVINGDALSAQGISLDFDFNQNDGVLNLEVPFAENGTEIVMGCSVRDDAGVTDTDTVTFQIQNAPPIQVDAGPNQDVDPGSLVDLVGTVTDPARSGMAHHVRWIQVAGPAVNLITPNMPQSSFVAPADLPVSTTLVFELQGSRTPIDGNTIFAENERDRVFVQVLVEQGESARLIANAGPVQNVEPGVLVNLNGWATDPDGIGGPYYYEWEQLAGPPVFLSGRNLPSASFTAPHVEHTQDLIFELRVSRAPISVATLFAGSERSSTMVQVTAVAEEPPPALRPLVANAGAVQNVESGAAVQLSGSVTDPDNTGGPYYYEWEQLAGPPVFLSGRTSLTPSFLAPDVAHSQDLIFELRVSREPIGGGTAFTASERDSTMVRVAPEPEEP